MYTASTAPGHCECCDARGEIAHVLWLLCGYCTRVVQSYRMGRLSGLYVRDQLAAVAGSNSPFTFVEGDPVLVRRPERSRKRRLATVLDVRVLAASNGVHVLWIEVKAGPSAIDEMDHFQLDCSDCDDITNVVETSGLPALLAHVQFDKVPDPPTMRLTGLAAWWTDLESFADNFIETAPRRGNERKMVARFRTASFRPLEELPSFLANGGIDELASRLRVRGIPRLYPETPSPPRKPMRRPKRSKS